MVQKTYSMKASEISRKWFVVDAEGKILGRLATEVARIIRGKHKPTYSPHLDMGDVVVIINADKVVLTGMKEQNKEYWSHSKYPGGQKLTSVAKYRKDKPEFILEHAVRGMLPKGPLGRKLFTNHLKVVVGAEHPYKAQKPEKLEI
jgi:large subunit ribosomal protein L13